MSGVCRDSGALTVAFLVCGAMSLSPLCARAQTDGASAEVEAREIAFAKTMADRDWDAFLSFVSPEAIFFNGNEPLRVFKGGSPFWVICGSHRLHRERPLLEVEQT